jgi:hypothetical protein
MDNYLKGLGRLHLKKASLHVCMFTVFMCVISFMLNKCLFVVSCTSLWPRHKISAPATFFECRRSIRLGQRPFGLHLLCIVFLLSNFLLKYCHFFSSCFYFNVQSNKCIFFLSFFFFSLHNFGLFGGYLFYTLLKTKPINR